MTNSAVVERRRCVKCKQPLDASNKDKTCRNTKACEERAGHLKVPAKAIPEAAYEFAEGSAAWHIVQATGLRFNLPEAALRTLKATHDSARIKQILCYLLRQDAKVVHSDIAKFLGMKSNSNAHMAHQKVTTHMEHYRGDILAIRECYSKEMKEWRGEALPSVLKAVA
jgi:hypothetical protein